MSAMMEEISDDGNGDSTFEFVDDKNVEGNTTTSSLLSESSEKPDVSSPNPILDSKNGTHSLIKEDNSIPLVPSGDVLQPPQPTPFFPAIPQAIQNTPSALLYYPVTSSLPQTNHSFSSSTVQSSVPTEVQPSSIISMPSATVDLPLEAFSYTSKQTPQEGSRMWGWLKGSELLNKVAEKAKNSVDSMITTLDPGMKEIIYSGGDVSILVASDKEVKVSPIREAFQYAFGRATVDGAAAQSCNIAAQPVGFAAGLKAAEERIAYLRNQGGMYEHRPIVAVENFLVELTPDRWYDIGCLVLQDSRISLTLHTYTQTTPVPIEYITLAQEQTPPDYPLRWSGLAVTIGQVMNSALGVSRTEWHHGLLGVSRREMLLLAAKSLAGFYLLFCKRQTDQKTKPKSQAIHV